MPDFWNIVEKLKTAYGSPAPPVTRDPFELIVYENRAQARKALKPFPAIGDPGAD